MSLTAAESLEILELVARADDFATARDASAYAELFTKDGTVTGETGTATGRDAIRDAAGAIWAAQPADTLYLTSNATIDESGPEPKVTSVLLTVARGPAARVLGSAHITQVVRRTVDGWRIASSVTHDASVSEPAATEARAPLRGPLAVRLQAPSLGAVVGGVLILTACPHWCSTSSGASG